MKREKFNLDAYENYLQGQISELITNYGPLLTIWNDVPNFNGANYGQRGADTIRLVRRLQPNILINNRTGDGGDYDTPEQKIGKFDLDSPWESCMTVSKHNAWAWGGANDGVKPVSACIEMLVRGAGGDGNVLLNVGPRPDGEMDPAQVALLKEVGAWLAKNGEAIYGTRGGPWKSTVEIASTRKRNSVYVQVFNWPGSGVLKLPNLPAKLLHARLLSGGKVAARQTDSGLDISVANGDRQGGVSVVALDFDSNVMMFPVVDLQTASPSQSK